MINKEGEYVELKSEIKEEIKIILKEMLNILESSGKENSDIHISDIYYLLSLYSLNIISYDKLKVESITVIKGWHSVNSKCDSSNFYFSDENGKILVDLNKRYTYLESKLFSLVSELSNQS